MHPWLYSDRNTAILSCCSNGDPIPVATGEAPSGQAIGHQMTDRQTVPPGGSHTQRGSELVLQKWRQQAASLLGKTSNPEVSPEMEKTEAYLALSPSIFSSLLHRLGWCWCGGTACNPSTWGVEAEGSGSQHRRQLASSRLAWGTQESTLKLGLVALTFNSSSWQGRDRWISLHSRSA